MYSRADVEKHNSEKDAWVTYKGQVLDVTYFLETHPGGGELLQPLLGKDVTAEFSAATHSYSAHRMIEDLRIGSLTDAPAPKPVAKRHRWDPTKGMIYQVWTDMTLKEYLDMVNNPTHLAGHVRLFDAPYLEVLTKTKWYLIPSIWLPVAAYYFYCGLQYGYWTSVFFFLGLLIWTLMEYGLHRYVFHSESHFKEDNRLLTTLHFLSHGIHHAFPMDK